MNKTIVTERLLIRPIKMSDGTFMMNLVNTIGWLKFIGDRNVRNADDAARYIQRIMGIEKFYYNVFEIKDTGQPIGIVTFIYRGNQEHPDIGFALLPEFEKNGYAFEAAKAYLDEIVASETCDQILGITFSENLSSISLLEKLGLELKHKFMEGDREKSVYQMKARD